MSTENKALARRWFEEVWNQQRKESIAEVFAANAVAHGLAGDEGGIRGPEAFAAFQAAFVSKMSVSR